MSDASTSPGIFLSADRLHARGGMYFEDFTPGLLYEHRLRRTVTQMDNMLFSNMTLNPQPLHIDVEFCEKETEWGKPLMNSLFTLGLMIGMSVNDLTVGTTIANLGMTDVKLSQSPVRGRHHSIHDRDRGQARIEVPTRCRNSRIPPPGLQAGRHAGRRMPPAGLHEEAPRGLRRRSPPLRASHAFAPFRSADSPRKLEKGLGSGADVLLLDLEDSVAPQAKAAAREAALAFLAENRSASVRPRLYVRVNALDSGLTDADLDA